MKWSEGDRLTIEIQGFHVPYITPPIPPKEQIAGWDLPKKEQKWIRPIFPSDEQVEKFTKKEKSDLIEIDFRRRLFGYWFMNNGVPTYVTGSHYFLLTHWYMAALNKTGFAEYREAGKKWYYVIDICEKDPNCYGAIMACQKRFGKTEMALAHLYNVATLIDEDGLFGMQSLSATEAKNNLFRSRLMRSHKRIQNYLKPISNETGSRKEIITQLTFMGENLGGGQYKAGLNNVIDWRPTLVSAYQGKRPREIFIDEPGSVEEMDLIEWWSTVREQLAQGTEIIYGRAFLPTTIEDMKKKGALAYKEIWDDSDPNPDKLSNGRTTSGLYRYLKPFYLGREGCIDEYGNDLIDKAVQFRENQLKNATPAQARKIKHQYPANEAEMFDYVTGGIWEDDVKELLQKFLIDSTTEPIRYVKMFMNEGKVDATVVSKNDDTAVKIREEPKPKTKYSLGIDNATTDDETGDAGGSKVSASMVKGVGEGLCMYSEVMVYSERADNKESCYHKIFLMAMYAIERGAELEIIGEINGGGADCFRYLCNRGLKQYMAGTPKEYSNSAAGEKNGKYWLYVNGDVLNYLHALGNRFIRFCAEHGTGIKTPSLVKSLIKYKGGSNEDEASSYLIAIWKFRDFDKPVVKKAPKPVERLGKVINSDGSVTWQLIKSGSAS